MPEVFPKVESCRTKFVLQIELICHNRSINAGCCFCILDVGTWVQNQMDTVIGPSDVRVHFQRTRTP